MPKVKISEYSATANSNTDVASINIDEGCAPSGINNAIRAVMGHLKDFQQGTNGDPFNGPVNGTVGATTPAAGAFTTLSSTGNSYFATSSGSVGIGTSSPGVKLDVSGAIRSTAATPILYLNNGTTQHSIANSSGAMPFTIDGTEQMRLTSTSLYTASGISVGIGTSSPASRLDVLTTTTALRLSTAANQTHIQFNDTTNSKSGFLNYTNDSLIYFRNGPVQVFNFDSSGNLGLGITPDASDWNASMRVFHAYQNTTNGAGVKLQSSNAKMIMSAGNAINYIGSIGATPIQFVMNSSAAMTLDASGNLLVGITSGATGLINAGPVAGKTGIFGSASTAGNPGIQGAHTANSATGYVAYFSNSGSTTGLYISNTAAWQSTSDERLKTDIQDLDSTQRLMQLRPRDYLWKSQETSDDPTKRNLGFIAQEVKDIFPELVGVSPDGMFSVEYTGLIAPLVKAIQEQQALITQLTARITALESA